MHIGIKAIQCFRCAVMFLLHVVVLSCFVVIRFSLLFNYILLGFILIVILLSFHSRPILLFAFMGFPASILYRVHLLRDEGADGGISADRQALMRLLTDRHLVTEMLIRHNHFLLSQETQDQADAGFTGQITDSCRERHIHTLTHTGARAPYTFS